MHGSYSGSYGGSCCVLTEGMETLDARQTGARMQDMDIMDLPPSLTPEVEDFLPELDLDGFLEHEDFPFDFNDALFDLDFTVDIQTGEVAMSTAVAESGDQKQNCETQRELGDGQRKRGSTEAGDGQRKRETELGDGQRKRGSTEAGDGQRKRRSTEPGDRQRKRAKRRATEAGDGQRKRRSTEPVDGQRKRETQTDSPIRGCAGSPPLSAVTLSPPPPRLVQIAPSLLYIPGFGTATFVSSCSNGSELQLVQAPVFGFSRSPTYILMSSPSLSPRTLDILPLSPVDGEVAPDSMCSYPPGSLSDCASQALSPPSATPLSPRTEEYIHQAKAHLRGMCQEMEAGLSLASHYVDVRLVQRQILIGSGKNTSKCLEKDLVVIGDAERRRGSLARSQVFESSPGAKPKRSIVLLGNAGMGKSTLIKKLCVDWSDGLLPQFDFVFLLDGKALTLPPEPTYSLRSLLLHLSCPHPRDVFNQVLSVPERVLVIFDGFEVVRDLEGLLQSPADDSKGENYSVRQLFSGLLQRKLLPGCSLLLSARPRGTVSGLLKRADSLLELSGFSPPDIERYLGQYFSGQSLEAPTSVPASDSIPVPNSVLAPVPDSVLASAPVSVPVPVSVSVSVPVSVPASVPVSVPVPVPASVPVTTSASVPVPTSASVPASASASVPVPVPVPVPVLVPIPVPAPVPTSVPVPVLAPVPVPVPVPVLALTRLHSQPYLLSMCWNPALCHMVCLLLEHWDVSDPLPSTLTGLCYSVLLLKMRRHTRKHTHCQTLPQTQTQAHTHTLKHSQKHTLKHTRNWTRTHIRTRSHTQSQNQLEDEKRRIETREEEEREEGEKEREEKREEEEREREEGEKEREEKREEEREREEGEKERQMKREEGEKERQEKREEEVREREEEEEEREEKREEEEREREDGEEEKEKEREEENRCVLSELSGLAWQGVKGHSSLLTLTLDNTVCVKLRLFGLRTGLVHSHWLRGEQGRDCGGGGGGVSSDNILSWAHPFLQSFLGGAHLSVSSCVSDRALLAQILPQPRGRRRPQGECLDLAQRFAVGLLFRNNAELRDLATLDTGAMKVVAAKRAAVISHLENLHHGDLSPARLLEACHCVFETGDIRLVRHLVRNLPEVLSFQGVPLCPADAFVVWNLLDQCRTLRRRFCLGLEDTGLRMTGLKLLTGLNNIHSYRACIADTITLWEELEQSGEEELLKAVVSKLTLNPFRATQVSHVQHLSTLVNIHTSRRLSESQSDGVLGEGLPAVRDLHKLEFELGPVNGPLALPKLLELLPALHSLHHLDLENSKLGDSGAEGLAGAVLSLSSLQIINLSQNCIGDQGIESLAPALSTLPSLHCLSLYSNVISDGGAESLAAVLPQMTSLSDLDVKYNSFTALGAQSLASSLRDCPWIKSLGMWNVCIPYGVLERLQQQDPRIQLL